MARPNRNKRSSFLVYIIFGKLLAVNELQGPSGAVGIHWLDGGKSGPPEYEGLMGDFV